MNTKHSWIEWRARYVKSKKGNYVKNPFTQAKICEWEDQKWFKIWEALAYQRRGNPPEREFWDGRYLS